MPAQTGAHALGPDTATLTVKTGKAGAAAKAGHDLVIEVGAWSATIDLAEDPSQTTMSLTADARSLRVLEGSGGMQALGDEDKAGIAQTIDEEVLKGTAIAFSSTSVTPGAQDGRLAVEGELELWGVRRPIAFDLTLGADGAVAGSATVAQTDFGTKPYSALFGTLKVADEVVVVIDGRIGQ